MDVTPSGREAYIFQEQKGILTITPSLRLHDANHITARMVFLGHLHLSSGFVQISALATEEGIGRLMESGPHTFKELP